MYAPKRGNKGKVNKLSSVEQQHPYPPSLEAMLSKINLNYQSYNETLLAIEDATVKYFEDRHWETSLDNMISYVLSSIDKISQRQRQFVHEEKHSSGQNLDRRLTDFVYDIGIGENRYNIRCIDTNDVVLIGPVSVLFEPNSGSTALIAVYVWPTQQMWDDNKFLVESGYAHWEIDVNSGIY